MIDAFCKGCKMQVRKEEREAEAIVALIDSDTLHVLCIKFDNDVGDYPEHEYEGAAFFAFFEELKKEVKKRIWKEIKMDNEGLLAWGEYEVIRAREVLVRAEAHRGELREIVRLEKVEEAKEFRRKCGVMIIKGGKR